MKNIIGYFQKIITNEEISKDKYCRNFLLGIIKIKFIFSSYVVQYKFLGIKIFTKTFDYGFSIYKFLKVFKFKTSKNLTCKFLFPILVKYIKYKAGLKKFEIIPIQNHVGETYLLMQHLNAFFNKHCIKNPIFISRYSNLNSICHMFFPDINFLVVPNVFFELYFADFEYVKDKNFKYYSMLPYSHFVNLEKSLRNNENKKFYQEILKTLKISDDLADKPKFNKATEFYAEEKMKLLNLKKPFVYISPDAKSNGSMCYDFWDKLFIELKRNGYDVFFNSLPCKMYNSCYKSCYLNFEEAAYVARKSDIVIGIRSGLMDIISNENSKIFCIYSAFLKRDKLFPVIDAQKVLNCFSLKQLRHVNKNNIFEYNGDAIEYNLLLEKIICKIKELQQQCKDVAE